MTFLSASGSSPPIDRDDTDSTTARILSGTTPLADIPLGTTPSDLDRDAYLAHVERNAAIRTLNATDIVVERWDDETYSNWDHLTADLALGLPRNALPAAVEAIYEQSGPPVTAYQTRLFREALEDAWTSAEYPAQALFVDTWIDMFRTVGFISTSRELPTQPVTLWRGTALEEHRDGMSWTDDVDRAHWFAGRFGRAGHVHTATVAPAYLLAYFDNYRSESEWVVDPAGLVNP